MAEGVAIGRAELGGEIDVAAELEHAVVVALEDRVPLLVRQRKFLQVFGFVRLEGLAVFLLHQRHAEHVDAVPLARPFGVEHERAGNVVIIVLRAWHRHSPLGPDFRSSSAVVRRSGLRPTAMTTEAGAHSWYTNDISASAGLATCRGPLIRTDLGGVSFQFAGLRSARAPARHLARPRRTRWRGRACRRAFPGRAGR